MRKHLAALALLSVLASPVPASAQAVIKLGDVQEIPADPLGNSFKPQLNALGYTHFTKGVGTNIILDHDSWIDFYFVASESGYENSFFGPDFTGFLDVDGNGFPQVDDLGTSLPIKVSKFFSAGSLAGQLVFKSGLGEDYGLGSEGFGIFLKGDYEFKTETESLKRLIFGFDDQNGIFGDDDNHDDMIVLANVRAVPEPGTWATLLFGFGALGAAMRRKSKALRIRPTFA